jgi:hypothetical protein
MRRLHKYIKSHGNQKKAAAALGVSSQYLNDVILGKRDPGPKILTRLGLKRVPRYEDSRADTP